MILFLYVLMFNTIAFMIWGRFLNSLDSFARDKKNEHRLFWFVINGSILSIILTAIMYPLWEKTLFNLTGFYFSMNPFVAHFLIVGPVEEFSKFAVFITISGMLKSIKEPRDAVLQAASVALGFALIENFMYAMDNGLIVLVIRSVISTAGHISYGIIWGFAWGAAVYSSEGKKISPDWLVFIPAFASAAVFHGAFNTFIDYGYPLAAIFVKLVTLTIFYLIYKYSKKNSPYRAYSLSEYRNAVPALKKGLKNHPDSPVLNKRLGLYFMYAGRYSAAEKYLRIAKIKDWKNSIILFYYGTAVYLNGNKTRGYELMNKALASMQEGKRYGTVKTLKKLITDEIILKDILSDYNRYTDRFELYSSRKKDLVRNKGYYYVSPENKSERKGFTSGCSTKNRTQRIQGTWEKIVTHRPGPVILEPHNIGGEPVVNRAGKSYRKLLDEKVDKFKKVVRK